ncbi:DUF948 domain-containing protein [Marininema halotolerans]|nr:DUF948 domain-containing protein [Marininema halotolerans]
MDISIAVVAVAFVALVIALVMTLKRVMKVLDSVDHTLKEVEPQVEEVIARTKRTLDETNALLEDIREKSRKTDSLFQTVDHIGNGLQELSSTLTRTASAQKERLSNVTALFSSGWDLFRKRRSERSSEPHQRVK